MQATPRRIPWRGVAAMGEVNARLPIHSGPRVSGGFEAKRGDRWQAAPFAWNAVSRCAYFPTTTGCTTVVAGVGIAIRYVPAGRVDRSTSVRISSPCNVAQEPAAAPMSAVIRLDYRRSAVGCMVQKTGNVRTNRSTCVDIRIKTYCDGMKSLPPRGRCTLLRLGDVATYRLNHRRRKWGKIAALSSTCGIAIYL